MTRPFLSLVRADTIDLQDAKATSTNGHVTHPEGLAPHQASTLREVAHQSAEDESRSPRLSWVDDNHNQQQQQQEEHTESIFAGMSNGVMSEDEHRLDGAHGAGGSSEDEEEELDDDMMDRISSSPSIEDEDIDFEFVYALHTFVATVEGQANATKGDTMVLLDDSNSYWWLVRVVKDSSIGYLPAEHIETPTERLARLNKHRNVDLSAAMLGDNPQKQKSTFRPIRRMTRKTVTFSEPTYVDYTEIDYSTEEDDDFDDIMGHDSVQQQKESSRRTLDDDEIPEDVKVEPLKTRTSKDDVSSISEDDDDERSSDEIVERKTKNGNIRNTDSFYKDDSVETKKITLTPNLLRDDNASRSPQESSASKEAKTRASLERKIEAELVADKDKKKNKDKKPSAIRSFFSRKDKKKGASEDDEESLGKRSIDTISDSRDSEDPLTDDQSTLEKNTVSRSSSKSQKQHPRVEPSVVRKSSLKKPAQDLTIQLTEPTRTNDVSNVPPASMRIIDPETNEPKDVPSNQHQVQISSANDTTQDKSATAPSTTVISMAPLQLTSQLESDTESDSSDDTDDDPTPLAEQPSIPGAFPDSQQVLQKAITPLASTTAATSPLSSNISSSSPVAQQQQQQASSPQRPPDLIADSPSGGEEDEWDDTQLRAFFDDGEHVRDLMAVVYDVSDVEVSERSIFREQNAKLAEITTQLDNMLGDWLARKQRMRGTV